MLAALLDELTWRSASGGPRTARIELMATVGSGLAAALLEAGGAALRDAVQDAAPTTLVRLLGAPECCRVASEPGDDVLDQVASWLAVEAAIADGRSELDRPAWSALGDRFLPGSERTADAWGISDPLTAPTAHGIVVDFASPQARRTPRSSEHRAIRMEAPVPMTAGERAATLDKLDAALATLAAACPAAYRFVTTLTRVIVPRKDSIHPDFYTSGSIRSTIGRTALNNPHLAGVPAAAVISSLVHEAIHAYIYIQEREHPLVTDWDAAFEVDVVSPWTGSVLSLPTYIHACFVWFGLEQLWQVPALVAAIGESTACTERERAATGFRRGAIKPLAQVRGLVAVPFHELIERMHDAR